ncbi:fucose permease [Chitinophaga skermanii]|uniref:Fucose permease n=1 Tax=Chitinophaga skermanii TaxID=331697 RepID=A0A327R470_9BACT|nr:MFS transporter [Chitinophaga skermanii]RAJ10742.1 fucose permease [Chitinophaga skermanii]
MNQSSIQPQKLFVASCLALLVTSLSFGIRAGILNTLGQTFQLDMKELGIIAGTAFWGFPLAVVIGGFIVDKIGMKNLLVAAFVLHLAGILLTIFATGFWELFISTLFIGMANGTVEAACNPLVVSIFPNNKTTKLNYFHLWFPGGIVIGTLISYYLGTVGGVNYKWLMAIMLIPTFIYGYLFLRLKFPVTERVASGISTSQMYRALGNPLFIVIFILMAGTAVTELYTGQWIEILMKNVVENSILILAITTGVQTLGRAFAGPIVHKMSPAGVLLISSILAALGLYMMSTVSGNMVFVAAVIFGLGVTYFWPCMLGFVSENIPESGALGMNLVGGMGMFAVSIFTSIIGGHFDTIIAAKLPAGADYHAYVGAAPGSTEAAAYAAAQSASGPEILQIILYIPLVLIVAFTCLVIYMRKRKNQPHNHLQTQTA